MDLSDNKLTGTLPYALSLVHDLRLLDLSSNSLSGPLPLLLLADHLVVSHVPCQQRWLTVHPGCMFICPGCMSSLAPMPPVLLLGHTLSLAQSALPAPPKSALQACWHASIHNEIYNFAPVPLA